MASAPVRLTSLDAFRGFTIAAMVLVNNPGDWGSLYPQLAHAKWHGWTFTDTIFPFFLFIGGVAMALSLGRLAAGGADKLQLLRKLAVRAAIIFLIGFLLNLIPRFDFGSVRARLRAAAAGVGFRDEQPMFGRTEPSEEGMADIGQRNGRGALFRHSRRRFEAWSTAHSITGGAKEQGRPNELQHRAPHPQRPEQSERGRDQQDQREPAVHDLFLFKRPATIATPKINRTIGAAHNGHAIGAAEGR